MQEIRLFSGNGSAQAIKSPVKLEILNLLEQGACSFDTIVDVTGKAKSTISTHIKDLEEKGILFSHPDPTDLRRRVISKNAIFIGTLTNQETDLEDRLEIPKDIDHLESPDLFRIILMTLRVEALALGINVDPVFTRVGSQIANYVAPWFVQSTLEHMLNTISEFWTKHGLGTVVVKSIDPIIIEISDCIECSQHPVTGKTECHLFMGFLKTLFCQFYQFDVMVTENTCYAAGDNLCTFEITTPSRPNGSTPKVVS
ncbi:MAG: ArsR family transcriptional regulator [Methanomicrobiales archaeon]|nr:ArsR family transcriptional regulator [Methanomicrobiales archaeon]